MEVIENIWIPLKDGTRLAARLWLPDQRPASAILEYIPYRKTDGTRGRDEPMHGFFAEQGFAAIRVDQRGTGESEGLCADEYTETELSDACEVIDWISRQDWCSGRVGMMGKSWGGFNCLQVAAQQPPALKAVVTVCSTVDRFNDDIHYMGGTLLNDNQWWGTIMLAYQARPLDARFAGETWRQQWLDRLEAMPFWPALWLAHPTRDAYWKHGSVGEDFSAITVPVLAFGGWADSYTNAVPALLEGLSVPRRGIIGPWAHLYPHDGYPSPPMGFLDEACRWWHRHLDGVDNGIDDEPMLISYLEDSRKPVTTLEASPGRWVAEPVWPSPNVAMVAYHLNRAGLEPSHDEVRPEERMAIRSPAYTGSTSGEWMGAGCISEMPSDQRLDDGFSLVFDTQPLASNLDILGRPVLDLTFSVDKPTAQLCVRLNDVDPQGASLRVSYQPHNLNHLEGFQSPEPLVPGKLYHIRIPLKMAGHAFKAGHRIRVAISTAYWPISWPSADAATLSIVTGRTKIELPVRTSPERELAADLPPARQAAAAPATVLREGTFDRTMQLDLVSDVMTYVTDGRGGVFGEGVVRFDDVDVTLSHDLKRNLSIRGDDPLSARAEMTERYEMVVAGKTFVSEIETLLTASQTHFHMSGSLKVTQGDNPVFERSWRERISRWPL